MSEETTQVVEPTGQESAGAPAVKAAPGEQQEPLTPEELRAALRAAREESAKTRKKLRAYEEADEEKRKASMSERERLEAELKAERERVAAMRQVSRRRLVESLAGDFTDPSIVARIVSMDQMPEDDVEAETWAREQVGAVRQRYPGLLRQTAVTPQMSATNAPKSPPAKPATPEQALAHEWLERAGFRRGARRPPTDHFSDEALSEGGGGLIES